MSDWAGFFFVYHEKKKQKNVKEILTSTFEVKIYFSANCGKYESINNGWDFKK